MTPVLDAATRGLVRVALALPHAPEVQLADLLRRATEDGAPAIWIEELLLSSVLYVGYARTLVAAGVFRRLVPDLAPGSEESNYDEWRQWVARGEATCRTVYGKHYDQLRHNVRALHPALESWMIVDGYGKTLSRPGLDLKHREFCSVGMLIPQRVPRQLVAHLRGALNAGASAAELDEVLAIAASMGLDADVLEIARNLWQELRDTLLHD
jgi:4-carboxymuconolactone decarboxylase